MRPIDADELRDIYSSVPNGVYTTGHIITAIDECKTIDAVPLDKLCEWLERYATMDCDGCRATIGSCEDNDDDEPICNSRERWKIMLTKWMDGLDDTN